MFCRAPGRRYIVLLQPSLLMRGVDRSAAASTPINHANATQQLVLKNSDHEVNHMQRVTKSVTINRPRDDVYNFWRDFGNLPTFMQHLLSVTVSADGRSRWAAKAPAGATVEWTAEIVEDRAGSVISWRSVAGSDVQNEGSVRFADAPADRGTEVRVELAYDAPAGSAGALVARMFGEEPGQQLRDDLRRFKQVLETGEVVRSDGSLEGAGQGALKQRPAQAPELEELKGLK